MNWALIIAIIANVESNNNPRAWNRSEDARGKLQIRTMVITDVNRYYKTTFSHDDAWNPRRAEDICIRYLKMWKADSIEKACRIWNGGPRGHQKKSTLKYWRKCQQVQRRMETRGGK